MVEQALIHPYNGILFSNKKEWTADTYNNLDGPQEHHAQRKKKEGLLKITVAAQIQMLFLESNLATYYKSYTFDLVISFLRNRFQENYSKGWGWGPCLFYKCLQKHHLKIVKTWNNPSVYRMGNCYIKYPILIKFNVMLTFHVGFRYMEREKNRTQ